MAPSDLFARDFPCDPDYYYNSGRCYPKSAWYWWGRWVLAGVILVFFIIVLVILGCISSRRRRKRGLQPMYGTGWMAPGNKFGQQGQQGQQWGGGYQYGAPPAYGQPAYGQPAYTQPPAQNQYTGTTTYNQNDGYYGGQSNDVPLQQPQHTYQRDQVYAPPVGPPPGK